MITKISMEPTASDDSSMMEQIISSPEPEIEVGSNTFYEQQKFRKEKQKRKDEGDEETNEEKEERQDQKRDKEEETYIKKDEGDEEQDENKEGKEKQKKHDETEDESRKEEVKEKTKGKEEKDMKRKKDNDEEVKEKHMKHDVGEEDHDRKEEGEEESKKTDDEKQSEKKSLMALSSKLKEDWREIKQYLEEKGIKCLYHFTDIRNIQSIKKHGGLFSWKSCEEHGIKIPIQGGNEQSKEDDEKYDLEDYVHLSFCDDHPMIYNLKKRLEAETGCKPQIVLLEISIDVAWIKDTLFSDMNAADHRHQHGETIEDLKNINIRATKMHYLRKVEDNFRYHQAEVMVKKFVPEKFIKNLNKF